MEQVSKYNSELANSVLSNPTTRICFRVGDIDARRLEHGFTNFDTLDLQNLHVGEAIAKVDTASQDFNLYIEPMPQSEEAIRNNIKETCINQSRNTFAKPRKEVEEHIFAMYEMAQPQENEVFEPVKSIEGINLEQPILIKPEIIKNDQTLEEKSQEYLKQVEEREKVTQHQYLQNLIKKMAESKGFKAVIEEPTPDRLGRVDIGLLKDSLKIAVEVSVTNTNDNEVNNILKCLNAGYNPVIMCSDNPRHLENIKVTAEPHLEKIASNKVLFYSPIELFAHLDTYTTENEGPEKRIKGYRVKVRYTKE